ncbi:MAG TPA: response regulator [Nitrospira sp.]|nr:response regulator [Nitrospira sp.]
MHILIVEDDMRIVGFMKRGLEAEAHDVDIASSKLQTLELITINAYDVVILDIFLGPDDGLDICRTLRQQGVRSSILLMTAKGTAEMEKASRSAGADAYLAKPFSFDDLIATVVRLGTSGIPTDQLRATLEPPACSQETHSAESFTKSDQIRPTTMTLVETDRSKCISINTSRVWEQS